eukprot:CAMPEP_0114995104 /NCGR_PEP_ID=MMETSP0216-20121206/13526_1 /TAXON_ID=223996 /ORGANISM="Protocruzia adherens, Strain Boccale" /LENGTH=200 /DNA_ID=CAMNT_0002359073 /DNA_START=77 /DNA_END=676 /DNA_ORIENTATION=+
MFLVVEIEDKIEIEPTELNNEYRDAVGQHLERKYLNKAIREEGICVGIQKLNIVDNFVKNVEGNVLTTVRIKFIVFKPFVGEIIEGIVSGCDQHFLNVSLGFTEIKIPVGKLMAPAVFDREEELWLWKYDEHDMYYDLGEKIRVKILDVVFKEDKIVDEEDKTAAEDDEGVQESVSNDELQNPMVVYGSADEEGLGLNKW